VTNKRRGSEKGKFKEASRPVLLCPRLIVRLPFRKFAWPKMAGILAIRKRSHSLTSSTRVGETAAEFPNGRPEIIEFLKRKWAKELDYRLIKELWAYTGNRIAVRFAYEWHDDSKNWFRSYGNENWEFDDNGFMRFRYASINDLPIKESERKYHWPLGRRPDAHPGLSELGL
jgi:nuclear transport factor 2 (NTF2) superfamily protein